MKQIFLNYKKSLQNHEDFLKQLSLAYPNFYYKDGNGFLASNRIFFARFIPQKEFFLFNKPALIVILLSLLLCIGLLDYGIIPKGTYANITSIISLVLLVVFLFIPFLMLFKEILYPSISRIYRFRKQLINKILEEIPDKIRNLQEEEKRLETIIKEKSEFSLKKVEHLENNKLYPFMTEDGLRAYWGSVIPQMFLPERQALVDVKRSLNILKNAPLLLEKLRN